MTWITIPGLARHAGRHIDSVRRALKIAGMWPPAEPGIRGRRIQVTKANRFLARQWPGTKPISDDEEGHP